MQNLVTSLAFAGILLNAGAARALFSDDPFEGIEMPGKHTRLCIACQAALAMEDDLLFAFDASTGAVQWHADPGGTLVGLTIG